MLRKLSIITLVGGLLALSAQANEVLREGAHGSSKLDEQSRKTLNFADLVADRAAPDLPDTQRFQARDGTSLTYRHYRSESPTALILIHGSATDSKYLANLARGLAEAGAANVFTPNVRGHGPAPKQRGDIDYIAQLEDDLADFIVHIQTTHAHLSEVVVGGHSSGGGLAIRFAGGEYGQLASAYLLLAPYLGHDAPTARENSGGWAQPSIPKIIAVSILNDLGLTWFNGVRVLRFNLPSKYRDGSETLAYSYRLMTGFNPSDYRKDLAAIKAPTLVVVGSEDEAFHADQFKPTIQPLVPEAEFRTVEGASHLGLVVNEKCLPLLVQWLRNFSNG